MVAIFGTIFGGLIGLAFGSFLNVCLSRWPAGASIVRPRSRCLHCGRTLHGWENVPVLSWLMLRGRCRTCKAWIGWRYPLVELTVGWLWAAMVWRTFAPLGSAGAGVPVFPGMVGPMPAAEFAVFLAKLLFIWLLVGLAVLDAEQLWLPDFVTLPGIVLGGLVTVWSGSPIAGMAGAPVPLLIRLLNLAFDLAISAGLVLMIRWLYWLVRHREGIGLGDAKLMAMLAAWLGLPGALLAFSIAAVLGAALAAVLTLTPRRENLQPRGLIKLPLGTFLCLGGLIATFYGAGILAAYLRWAGLG